MRVLWFAALSLVFLGSAAGFAQEAALSDGVLRGSSGFEQARPTLVLLVMAGSTVISLIALVIAVRKESRAEEREQVKAVEQRISEVEAQMRRAEDASEHRDADQTRGLHSALERLGQIEVQMKHLPDKETVQRLAIDVARMNGDVQSIARGLESVDAATTRIEDFLLNRAAK